MLCYLVRCYIIFQSYLYSVTKIECLVLVEVIWDRSEEILIRDVTFSFASDRSDGDGLCQTQLLAINLQQAPKAAEAILDMFGRPVLTSTSGSYAHMMPTERCCHDWSAALPVQRIYSISQYLELRRPLFFESPICSTLLQTTTVFKWWILRYRSANGRWTGTCSPTTTERALPSCARKLAWCSG